jgi:hypothetical protein
MTEPKRLPCFGPAGDASSPWTHSFSDGVIKNHRGVICIEFFPSANQNLTSKDGVDVEVCRSLVPMGRSNRNSIPRVRAKVFFTGRRWLLQ